MFMDLANAGIDDGQFRSINGGVAPKSEGGGRACGAGADLSPRGIHLDRGVVGTLLKTGASPETWPI